MVSFSTVPQANKPSSTNVAGTPSTLPQQADSLSQQIVGKPDAFERLESLPKPAKIASKKPTNKAETPWIAWSLLGGAIIGFGMALAIYHNKSEGKWGESIPKMQEDLGKVFGKAKQKTETPVKPTTNVIPTATVALPVPQAPPVIPVQTPPANTEPLTIQPRANSSTLKQRIALGLATFSVVMPTGGGVLDFVFNQSRVSSGIHACAVQSIEQGVKPFVTRSVEVPVSPLEKANSVVQYSSQLLPNSLPFTKNHTALYEVTSLKERTFLDLSGHSVTKNLYKGKQRDNQYFDTEGAEYTLVRNATKKVYQLVSPPTLSEANSFQVFGKRANQYALMQPFVSFPESEKRLKEQGLEVVSILGTTLIGEIPNDSLKAFKTPKNAPHVKGNLRPMAYNYINMARLNPDSKSNPVEYGLSFTKGHKRMLNAGFYTTIEGETKLLDLSKLSNTEIQRVIEALKQDKQVLAIMLHTPKNYSTKATTQAQSAVTDKRAFMVFDTEDNFLGSFISPRIGIDDMVTLAKAKYGSKVGSVLNLDGGGYATSMNFYGQVLGNDPAGVQNHLGNILLVQPKSTLPTGVQKLTISPVCPLAEPAKKLGDRLSDFSNMEKVYEKTSQKLQAIVGYFLKKVGF